MKKPSLFNLVVGGIYTFFFAQLTKKQLKSPKKINDYKLVKEIYRKDNNYSLAFGIYERNEKKYFIKFWQGKAKDLNYYYLVNELNSVKILQKYFNGFVKVPKIIDLIENRNSLTVIFEYIKGKPLQKYSIPFQANAINKILKEFTKITKKLTSSERDSFITRNYFYYPKSKLTIAQRDLTPDNFLIKGNKLYIVDCENFALTLPDFDFSYLTSHKKYKSLSNILKNKFGYKENYFLATYISIHNFINERILL